MLRFRFHALLLLLVLPALPALAQAGPTFVNPVMPAGPDPWVIFHDGFYYEMNSTGTNLTIRKTRDITDLAHAQTSVVWIPPATGPYSHEIWAPELHRLDGKWYIYFAADDGSNDHHRIWAIENAAEDPTEGQWTFKGKVAAPSDKWAIDATVFTLRGQNYIVWSGWEGDANGVQSLYIARLKNPWTIDGQRVRLSTPEHPWERVGDFPWEGKVLSLPHVDVNEGPEILQHGDRTFLTYSASGCWTNYYELGMLSLLPGRDPMDAAAWTKSDHPVFWQNPAGHAYGTGHNGFFPSPDGRQNWIIYHANPEPNQGCGNLRSPRIQPFTWNPDGTPNFGRPVPLGQPLEKPSGTQ